MNAKQKAKQIAGVESNVTNNAPDDSEVLIPRTEGVNIGGREYKIHGLPLRFIREFTEVLNVKKDSDFTEKHYRKLLEVVSKAVREPDIDFIEDNLTLFEVNQIIATAYRISMTGMPNPQGGAKKGGAHGAKV